MYTFMALSTYQCYFHPNDYGFLLNACS